MSFEIAAGILNCTVSKQRIGEGVSRVAYFCPLDGKVYKVSNGHYPNANRMEHEAFTWLHSNKPIPGVLYPRTVYYETLDILECDYLPFVDIAPQWVVALVYKLGVGDAHCDNVYETVGGAYALVDAGFGVTFPKEETS